MSSSLPVTRDQLREFIKDERTLRAFESLIANTSSVQKADIDSLQSQITALSALIVVINNTLASIQVSLQESLDIANSGVMMASQRSLF